MLFGSEKNFPHHTLTNESSKAFVGNMFLYKPHNSKAEFSLRDESLL